MLKVKKSHKKGYIVYDSVNFKYHTHVFSKDMAHVIRSNVENSRMPKTNNIRILYSHLRVSQNQDYKELIRAKIKFLSCCKKKKHHR